MAQVDANVDGKLDIATEKVHKKSQIDCWSGSREIQVSVTHLVRAVLMSVCQVS